MKKDKKNSKAKRVKIITVICFAIHLIPVAVLFPLLCMNTIFVNELEIEWLSNFFTVLLLISMLIYVIGIFLAPLIQFVLAIAAVKNKKWKLVGIHMVSMIALCGGIVLFIKIFSGMVYAT